MALFSRRIGILIAIAALVVPAILPSFYLHVLVLMCIFAIFAMSLDLLMGYGGLPSLGHAAFYGIAAYVVGIMSVRYGFSWPVVLPAALLVTALTGALLGLVALRTTELYFMLITLAMSQILWGVANRWGSFTGGFNGLPGIGRPSPLLSSTLGFYYFALAVTVAIALLLVMIVRSPFGLSLQGIRDSESRMRMLGYDVWLHKYVAFTLSAVFAGVAGVLSAYYTGFVSPADLSIAVSAEAILMVIFGGAGTLIGPVIGALVIVAIRNFLSVYVEHWQIVLGLVFIIVVLFAPEGIMGWIKDRRRSNTGIDEAPASAPASEAAPHTVIRFPAQPAEAVAAGSAEVLRLESISKSFGALRAVQDVSLTVRTGERVALLGQNGAGKTTLFHLITGMFPVDRGDIVLFGQNVTRTPTRQRIGLGLGRTFQITNLFPALSVLDNARISVIGRDRIGLVMHRNAAALDAIDQAVRESLEPVGLWRHRDVEVRHLSYGHQRQLEVAMVMAQKPKLLLLDEPAAGLSVAEVRPVVDLIHALPRSVTILIIEHDMDVALEVAERIVVFHQGQKLFDGPARDVHNHPDVRRIYLGNRVRP